MAGPPSYGIKNTHRKDGKPFHLFIEMFENLHSFYISTFSVVFCSYILILEL